MAQQPYNPNAGYNPPQYGQPQQAPPYGEGGPPPQYQQTYGQQAPPQYSQQPPVTYQQQQMQPPHSAAQPYQQPPPQGPKGYGPVDNQGEKFQEPSGWRDKLWAAIFYIHFIGMCVLIGYYINKNKGELQDDGGEEDLTQILNNHLAPILAALLVGSLAVTIGWIIIMRSCAKFLIWFTLGLSIVAWAIGALASFAVGSTTGGFIMLIFLAINILYVYLVRHRIAFATAMLEITIGCLQQYNAAFVVSLVGTVMQMAWIVLWSLGAAFALEDIQSGGTSDGTANFVYFFLVLSMFWTAQVIHNVVHVSVAGLVATWYFLAPAQMPSNPTRASFKRAMTTSFGSICLGSLIVAIIQTIRFMVQTAASQENDLVRCCALCILNCIESLVQYFNMYAFTQVAIYGKSYCAAAKDTWGLFKSKGFDAIINDDLIGGVLSFGALFGGLVVLGISLLMTAVVYDDVDGTGQIVWGVVGFVVGFIMVLCAMVVIQSGVATIFVCFAEDPVCFHDTKPGLYQKLEVAWNRRYGQKDGFMCPGGRNP